MVGKISDMTAASYAAPTDLSEVVQGGVNKKIEHRVKKGQKVSTLAISSGVLPVDVSLGDYFTLTLTENITSWTFSGLPGAGFGCTVMVLITQAATAKTVAWPSSFKWDAGAAPVVSTGSGTKDMLALTTFDNGTTWQATLSKGRA